jgi:hypothetical protein
MHAALRRFRAAIDAALSNLEAGPLIRAHSTAAKPDAENDPGRPWSEISDSGLLWLINTTVFHPRGYALAIHFDSDGVATGWSIMGDGLERWAFAQFGWPEGRGPDDAFLKIRALLP